MCIAVDLFGYVIKLAMHYTKVLYKFRMQGTGLFPDFHFCSLLRCLPSLNTPGYKCPPGNLLPLKRDVLILRPMLYNCNYGLTMVKRLTLAHFPRFGTLGIGRFNNHAHQEIKTFCKGEVAQVVRGYGHNGSRAIACKHIVRQIYRYLFFIGGVNCFDSP